METVTITRLGAPGVRDAAGVVTRSAGEEIESEGWFVPGTGGGGEDATDYGTSDVLRITVYNRGPVEVAATDVFTIRGRVWKVAGAVEPWASPWGTDLGGVAVTLERAG